jgi:F420H(2)-dependent quinone reductase
MSFQKLPGGTRGARIPPSNAVTRALNRAAMSWHRRSGDKFQGQDLLYLTTIGAKTGQRRQTAVARFPDGDDAWLVVASAAGSAHLHRTSLSSPLRCAVERAGNPTLRELAGLQWL